MLAKPATSSRHAPNWSWASAGIRSFDPALRDLPERRIGEVVRAQAESYGRRAEVNYARSYDATVNHKAETEWLRRLATRFAGPEHVVEMARPTMGSKNFACMLKAVTGSYFLLGSGTPGKNKPLHHPGFDFNDDLLPVGSAFWVELAEDSLRSA